MKQIIQSQKWQRIILFGLGFLLYAYSISFDYAQDDAIVITDNMFTEEGMAGIPDILSHDTFYGFFKVEGKANLVQGGRYRPATHITFAIEESLFGGNPHISHAINAILYGILCLLIYELLLILLLSVNQPYTNKNAIIIAFITSIVFATHPIHTEVVANIKGRDEIFVALFGILSMFLLWQHKVKWWHIVLAYSSILIAFFSKENAIIYVVILPLTIWFFGKNRPDHKSLWIRTLPAILLAGVFLLVRSQILGLGISEASTELMNNPFLKFDGSKMVAFSFQEKWATIIYNLGKYIQLMLVPFPLTSDYYPYHISIKSFANVWVILSALLHLGLIGLTIYGTIFRKVWAWGLAWYFGFLFLLSNIPFNIGTNISERFLFLPSIGFIFSTVYTIYYLLGKRSETRKTSIFPLLIVLILFSSYTMYRSQVWKNDFTLLTTDVKQSPNSAKALHGAAGALSNAAINETNEQKQKEYITRSNEYIAKALKLYPLYNNAYLIQGNNYQYLKQYDNAIASYNQLLRLSPEHKNALKNLHIAYRDGGRYYGEKMGDLDKAIAYLREAYKMNPNDYETVRLMGVSTGISGNNAEALPFFIRATELKPTDAYAWFNLGNAYRNIGDEANAQKYIAKAYEIDPNFKDRLE